MRYQVTLEGQAVSHDQFGPIDAAGLEAHLDRVMEELVTLRAEDATVAGTMAKGQVEISLVVPAPDLDLALERGQAIVRAAIESAAGSGSEWGFDWTSLKATRIESLARATG